MFSTSRAPTELFKALAAIGNLAQAGKRGQQNIEARQYVVRRATCREHASRTFAHDFDPGCTTKTDEATTRDRWRETLQRRPRTHGAKHAARPLLVLSELLHTTLNGAVNLIGDLAGHLLILLAVT